MKASRIILISVLTTLSVWAQAPVEGWGLFATVKFKTEYFKEYNLYLQVPVLDANTKAKPGMLVTLSGHYMPFEMQARHIILSKYPYASCFFCGGGGGPESVAEIVFAQNAPDFEPDQWITVQGKLKVNTLDIDRMNFIVENAVLIPQKK